jgi:hypothetical protein
MDSKATSAAGFDANAIYLAAKSLLIEAETVNFKAL